eukprot:tig00021537_g22260.t1
MRSLEVNPAYLIKGARIASGAYGVVWAGTYFGEPCAIKELHWGASSSELEDFLDELDTQASLRSEYVVQVIGVQTAKSPFRLVMERMDEDLGAVLASRRELPLLARVRIARQVACALSFMHNQLRPVLHRDVKSLNVMVRWRPELVAKLGDLGLATVKRATAGAGAGASGREIVGSYPWMAPEVMDLRPYTAKSDVFSFGTLLWEIVTREVPFKEAKEERAIERFVLDRGKRLPIPATADPVLRSIIEQCWHQEPARRPAMEAVVETLRSAPVRRARPRPAAAPLMRPAGATSGAWRPWAAPYASATRRTPRRRPPTPRRPPRRLPPRRALPAGGPLALRPEPALAGRPPGGARLRRRSSSDAPQSPASPAPEPPSRAWPAAAASGTRRPLAGGGRAGAAVAGGAGGRRRTQAEIVLASPPAGPGEGAAAAKRRQLRELAQNLRRERYGPRPDEPAGGPPPRPAGTRPPPLSWRAAGRAPSGPRGGRRLRPGRPTGRPLLAEPRQAGGAPDSTDGPSGPAQPPARFSRPPSAEALAEGRSCSRPAAAALPRPRRCAAAAELARAPPPGEGRPRRPPRGPPWRAPRAAPGGGGAASPGGRRLRKRISLSEDLDHRAASSSARGPRLPAPPAPPRSAAATPPRPAAPPRLLPARRPSPAAAANLEQSLLSSPARRLATGFEASAAAAAAEAAEAAAAEAAGTRTAEDSDSDTGSIGRPRSAPLMEAPRASPTPVPPEGPPSLESQRPRGGAAGASGPRPGLGLGSGASTGSGALSYACGGCGRPLVKHAEAYPHADLNDLLSSLYPRVRLEAQLTRARTGNGTLFDLWSVSCSGCFRALGRARGKQDGPPGSWLFLLHTSEVVARGASPGPAPAPARPPAPRPPSREGAASSSAPAELRGRCGSCLGPLGAGGAAPSRKELYTHEGPLGCGASFHRPCASYAVIQLKRCPQCRQPWAPDPGPARRPAR